MWHPRPSPFQVSLWAIQTAEWRSILWRFPWFTLKSKIAALKLTIKSYSQLPARLPSTWFRIKFILLIFILPIYFLLTMWWHSTKDSIKPTIAISFPMLHLLLHLLSRTCSWLSRVTLHSPLLSSTSAVLKFSALREVVLTISVLGILHRYWASLTLPMLLFSAIPPIVVRIMDSTYTILSISQVCPTAVNRAIILALTAFLLTSQNPTSPILTAASPALSIAILTKAAAATT